MKDEYTFYDDLFSGRLKICIGEIQRRSINKDYEKQISEVIEETDIGHLIEIVKDKKINYIIWLEKDFSIYTLMHEIVHLVHRILDKASIPIIDNNNQMELFAYYYEWWTRTIFNNMGFNFKQIGEEY